MVPFEAGELKIVGYNNDTIAAEYTLKTHSELVGIKIESNVEVLKANGEDIANINIFLFDKNGVLVTNSDIKVEFIISGDAELIAVDNGSENGVEHPKGNAITTSYGKAVGIIMSGKNSGVINVKVEGEGFESNELVLKTY